MSDMHHLIIVDGAFLHLESPEMPMHVGSVALFDAPAGGGEGWYDAVKAHVTSRMHLAPVFARKLAPMPFDLANPVWIHDDDIDLDYHMRTLVLPKPGTMAQLQALCARLHSSLLDRSRPLWEFYVIEGLADGRLAFYSKVHHAAVDGQAAVALAGSIFDLAPEGRRVKPPRPVRSNRYQLGVAELLGAAVTNQLQQLVQFARLVPPLAGAAWGTAKQAWAQRNDTDRVKLASRLKFAPPSPFTTPITNQRSFAAVGLPLQEVKAIGKAHGASINDMVLWLCSTALRTYLDEGRELPTRTLVAGVPVSLRAAGDTTSNNQVSGSLVDLATHEADPAARLAAVMAATRAMKDEMGVFGDLIPKDFPSLGSPWLLSGLASLYGRSRLAHRLRVANVVISNVPGAKETRYLNGARLLGIYPVSALAASIGLNVTLSSYHDHMDFGFVANATAIDDLSSLSGHTLQAYEQLRVAASEQSTPT